MDLQISDFRFRISVKIRSRIYMDHHDWWRSNFQCIVGCFKNRLCGLFADLLTAINLVSDIRPTHVCIYHVHTDTKETAVVYVLHSESYIIESVTKLQRILMAIVISSEVLELF